MKVPNSFALHGLRGFCLILIFLYNGLYYSNQSYLVELYSLLHVVGEFLLVYYGFMTTLALKELKTSFAAPGVETRTWKNNFFTVFYGRKVWRWAVVEWAAVTAVLVVGTSLSSDPSAEQQTRELGWQYVALGSSSSLWTNWSWKTSFSVLGHLWLPSSCFLFSLGWPAGVYFLADHQQELICAALALSSLLLKVLLSSLLSVQPLAVYYFPFCHLEALSLGAWFAIILYAKNEARLNLFKKMAYPLMWISGVVIVEILLWNGNFLPNTTLTVTLGNTCGQIFFACLFFQFVSDESYGKAFEVNGYYVLSQMAYSFYVWHPVFLPWFMVGGAYQGWKREYGLGPRLVMWAYLAVASSLASFFLLEYIPARVLQRFFRGPIEAKALSELETSSDLETRSELGVPVEDESITEPQNEN